MCMAIPMTVIAVDGLVARCEARGVERSVDLMLLQDENLAPGDAVTVHLGHAIARISPQDAALAWALFDQMLKVPIRV